MKALRRAVFAIVLGLAIVASPSGPVSAHAIVLGISPADGSALLAAPSEVVVEFSEPILADGLLVDVTASGTGTTPIATVGLDPADNTKVVVRLSDMDTGTYQVRVTVRDEEDLHEVVARTSFAVGEAAPAPSPPVIAGPEPVETGARWIFAAGLALLIGVAAVRTRWPDVPIDRPRRLHAIAVTGIAAVLAGRLGVLVARLLSLGGDRVDAARTVLGTSDARRIPLVLIAVGCVVVSEHPKRAVWLDVPLRVNHQLTCRQAFSWLGVVNLAVLASWGSHSALDGAVAPFVALSKSAHLMGLGLWVGVLAVVLVMNTSTASRRVALSAMSEIALFGALLMVVSGLALASELVVSLTAVAATPYGLALAVKIGLLVVAIGAGLVMRRGSRVGWSAGELVVLTGVVLLGAAMATATPAVDPAFTDDPPPVAEARPATATDDLLLQARAIPAHPGANTLEVRIGETRRPTLGEVTSVDIAVGADRYTAIPNAQGLAFVDGVVLPAGETAMSVVVRRAGWQDATATLSVATESPVFVQPTWISSARIRGPLLALAGGGLLVGLWIGYRARRRRSGPSDPGRHADDPGPPAMWHGIDELAARRQGVVDLDDVGGRAWYPPTP